MGDSFRPVEGFPGYSVSGEGRVQSRWNWSGRRGGMGAAWLPLGPIPNRWGHLSVNLHRVGRKRRRYVHHLVLEAFVGVRLPGTVRCHWDGAPANNRAENLRWDTHKANGADTIRHGRRECGAEAGSKRTERGVREIRRLHALGVPVPRLAADHGITATAVRMIVGGRSWRHLL